MEPLSEAELRQFAPTADQSYIDALVNGTPDLERAGVNTPARLCEFLGQTAHETGGFSIVRENTRWSRAQCAKLWPGRFGAMDPRVIACQGDPVKLANLVYGSRGDLGNRGGNDGWEYRGGSFLQTTGRDNYRRLGAQIGVPLEEHPELIERGDIGLKCALFEWQQQKCNEFADRGYTRTIGNAINRGSPYSSKEPIGAESRKHWRDRALAIFGDGTQIHDDGLALGAYGSDVEVLQRRLRDLHYPVGAPDKVFGPTLARAIAGFKLDHARAGGAELEPNEIVGPRTWAALNIAQPAPFADRTTATVADLKESTTINSANKGKKAVATVALAAVASGADQTGAADAVGSSLQSSLGWLPEMHNALIPVIDAVRFAEHNLLWVATLGGAVYAWMNYGDVIEARIKDHISGLHLGR